MADLTWGDVVLIGAVASVGFTLLSYWFSAVMGRRGWNLQVRGRRRRSGEEREEAGAASGGSADAGRRSA